MLKIKDKDGKLFTFRLTYNGGVLKKGNREIYLLYKSVNQGKKAKELINNYSFNKLFTKGKKIKVLGNNVSYIKV